VLPGVGYGGGPAPVIIPPARMRSPHLEAKTLLAWRATRECVPPLRYADPPVATAVSLPALAFPSPNCKTPHERLVFQFQGPVFHHISDSRISGDRDVATPSWMRPQSGPADPGANRSESGSSSTMVAPLSSCATPLSYWHPLLPTIWRRQITASRVRDDDQVLYSSPAMCSVAEGSSWAALPEPSCISDAASGRQQPSVACRNSTAKCSTHHCNLRRSCRIVYL
jgi:hypothetical protein